MGRDMNGRERAKETHGRGPRVGEREGVRERDKKGCTNAEHDKSAETLVSYFLDNKKTTVSNSGITGGQCIAYTQC